MGENNMTGEEIKVRLEENNKKIEEILKTDTFTLNHDIVNLMTINDELRESCPHEYNSNGICIYCLTENKGE